MIEKLILDGWAQELAEGRRTEALEGAAEALALAVACGAGYAESTPGQRLFDPVEVEDYLDWGAASEAEPFWSIRTRRSRTAYRAATRAIHRPDRRVADADPPSTRFSVSFRRTFDLRRFAEGSSVRLRLPTPLRSAYHQDIAVKPVLSPDLSARAMLSDGRLDIRLGVPADPMVTVGADFDFVGLPPTPRDAGRLDDGDREIHLRPSEGLIQVTPSVRELAKRLAGSKPPREAVVAFWVYLAEGFRFRSVRHDELSGVTACDWVLDNRGYDCLLCSALMVALCRAGGIPARMVTGHYLSRLCPANHSWVEIWIDGMGWAPFDLLHHERGDPTWRSDLEWWDHFARRWDYRMVFERLPLAFTGPMSVRFPPAWQMLDTATDGGIVTTYTDVADGSLIYQDRIVVDWLD